MSEKHEIKAGDTATVKVGRNAVQVKILKPMADDTAFMVKSLSSGKTFTVPKSRLVSIVPVELKPETKPTKKMSLMDAAVAVLRESGGPMNTREMVKAATEKGYWTPTACKTPEQTLYGASSARSRPRIGLASSEATSRASSPSPGNPRTLKSRKNRDFLFSGY